jgi:hypothetical protein
MAWESLRARIIREGSSRKRADAKETDTRRREAVCRRAERRDCPSQPRIRARSRNFMNIAGYKVIVLNGDEDGISM